MTTDRQRCRNCRRYAGFEGFDEDGLCPDCAAIAAGASAGGSGVVELAFESYEKPYLTVTDFRHVVKPLVDERTGELVGLELWINHPALPFAWRFMLARLYAVELATGILAVVDSHEGRTRPETGPERG